MNTIIEKIRAEVERLNTIQLKRIQEGDLVDAEPYGKNEAYNNVLSFLSNLEKEEKPIEGGGLVTLEYSNRCFLNGVEKGRSDMYKQMMKETVEGYISATNEVSAVLALPKGDFKKSDKVRIIIVKED